MNDAVLEVRGVRKRFGDVQALSGVDLTLERGAWLGLLGPNGAGKTTLVRAIAGRCPVDDGSLRLLGVEVNGPAGAPAAARARLGVVPQDVALYARLTARENLEGFAALNGLVGPILKERTAWALEFTGLADRADQLVGAFSGGMKRRLNIACSVMHRPEVILLDEPTVGVDPQSRERIWDMLRELRAAGASLLLTTHQLDEAQMVCERIVIIDHGAVIASGTLEELIARTVGSLRRVTLDLDGPTVGLDLGREVELGHDSVSCMVTDVATSLPDLLFRVQRAGRRVEDVHVESPTLQSVFLHLTGRELRE